MCLLIQQMPQFAATRLTTRWFSQIKQMLHVYFVFKLLGPSVLKNVYEKSLTTIFQAATRPKRQPDLCVGKVALLCAIHAIHSTDYPYPRVFGYEHLSTLFAINMH